MCIFVSNPNATNIGSELIWDIFMATLNIWDSPQRRGAELLLVRYKALVFFTALCRILCIVVIQNDSFTKE